MHWVIKGILFLGCGLVYLPTSAQGLIWQGESDWMGSPFEDSLHQQQVVVFSILEAGSNSLPSAFLNQLLTSGILTNALKDQGFSLLQNQNYGGFLLRHGATYHRQMPTSAWLDNWWLSLESRTQAFATFSQDLYGITLYGNARYEDQTAVLSGALHTLNSQALSLGGQSHIHWGEDKLTVGYGIRLVQGNSAQFTTISGTVYTAPEGAYLQGNFAGQFVQTDTLESDWRTTAGLGWGGHLQVQYQHGPWWVAAQGVLWEAMQWDAFDPSYQFAVNEQYEGIAISDLLSGEELEAATINAYIDTLSGRIPALHTTHISLQMGRHLKQWQLVASLRHLTQLGSSATSIWSSWGWQAQATAIRSLPQGWHVQAQFGIGGWAPYTLGASVQKSFPFGLQVRLGTNHLTSLALPQRLPGSSYHAAVSYAF